MQMEIMNNAYSGYAAETAGNGTVGGTKKKDAGQTAEKAESSKSEKTTDYMNKLSKLAPSVEFRVGNTFSTAKSGKTLTINPKLLEKMQKDPKQEKETKELIKGVESMTKLVDGINRASGRTVVYRHSYIDENGKYRSWSYTKKDDTLNKKLREERRKNAERLIEKTKEKAAEKKEELEEALEENKAENKAEQLINEKIEASKDGVIYLYDTDFRTIMGAAKEDSADKAGAKGQTAAGANLDLKA